MSDGIDQMFGVYLYERMNRWLKEQKVKGRFDCYHHYQGDWRADVLETDMGFIVRAHPQNILPIYLGRDDQSYPLMPGETFCFHRTQFTHPEPEADEPTLWERPMP